MKHLLFQTPSTLNMLLESECEGQRTGMTNWYLECVNLAFNASYRAKDKVMLAFASTYPLKCLSRAF